MNPRATSSIFCLGVIIFHSLLMTFMISFMASLLLLNFLNDVQHLLNKGVLAEFLGENKETKQVKTNQRSTKAKPE